MFFIKSFSKKTLNPPTHVSWLYVLLILMALPETGEGAIMLHSQTPTDSSTLRSCGSCLAHPYTVTGATVRGSIAKRADVDGQAATTEDEGPEEQLGVMDQLGCLLII